MTLGQDLRYALRMMKWTPGFAAAAIATLALGLGLNSSALRLVASAIIGPLLAHLLYGVSPHDPLAMLAGPCLLGAVALLAIWLPARRAMMMDPMAALRSE